MLYEFRGGTDTFTWKDSGKIYDKQTRGRKNTKNILEGWLQTGMNREVVIYSEHCRAIANRQKWKGENIISSRHTFILPPSWKPIETMQMHFFPKVYGHKDKESGNKGYTIFGSWEANGLMVTHLADLRRDPKLTVGSPGSSMTSSVGPQEGLQPGNPSSSRPGNEDGMEIAGQAEGLCKPQLPSRLRCSPAAQLLTGGSFSRGKAGSLSREIRAEQSQRLLKRGAM